MKPNVLLLTVDALRFDRLGLSGYKYDTSPVMDQMSKNAIWCESAFSLAPCTQPSMPTIITSTRPLSYGGYDLGIKNRPNPLPKILNDNDYQTTHEITFPWLRSTYGYDAGVDHVGHLYNITGIVGATIHTIRSHVLAYSYGDMAAEDMLSRVSPLLRQCFDDLDEYCQERIINLATDKRQFPHSFFAIQDYDYNTVREVVQAHRLAFENNPLAYVDTQIVGLPQNAANSWISKEIKFKRKLGKKVGLFSDKLIGAISSLINPGYSKLYRFRNKVYADSSELADRLIANIYSYKRSGSTDPFYIWTHFLDTHIPYCPGQLPNWPRNARKYFSDTGYSTDLNLSVVCGSKAICEEEKVIWNAAYDSCIRYTDEQIGRVISALEQTSLDKSTLVVIAGDHGEEVGEHGEYGHRFRYYDECINVPVFFYMPDFREKRISELSDLTDIAPTILGIADIECPSTYIGDDLSSFTKGKKFIQMEAFHRGNCLFEKKPLYMAVRSKTHKYIWREWIDEEDKNTNEEIELYDLIYDKNELKNIAKENKDIVLKLHNVIAQRLAEIPEYCASRNIELLARSGAGKFVSFADN